MTEVQDLSSRQVGVFKTQLPPLPDHPLVSILVPTYNEQTYVEETIHSILDQDYDAIELIIIDGASTDGTLDVLRKYERDIRVKWISEPDTGPTSAYNKGLKLAKGDLVGFQSANDTYISGAIREIVNEFAADPRLALVGGWTQAIDNHGTPTGRKMQLRSERTDYSIREILRFEGFTKAQATLFRRDILGVIGGFNHEVRIPGSFLWLHYMLEANRLGARCLAVPRVWANFREHPNQRHTLPEFSELAAFQDRNWGCKLLANLYKSYLTPKQIRLLRRSGYYFVLRHRVRNLRQIIPAIPAALGYVWFGGGPHVFKSALSYLVSPVISHAHLLMLKKRAE